MLSFSIASPARAIDPDEPRLELPSLRRMDPGLSRPCTVANDGQLIPSGANRCPLIPGTRVLPLDLWDGIKLFGRDCIEFEETARMVVGEHKSWCQIAVKVALTAQAAELAARHIKATAARSGDWPAWQAWLGMIGAGVLASVVVGAIVWLATVASTIGL